MGDWYKLDNAAKLFPSVANDRNSSVYRIAVVLNEKVDGALLQKTVDYVAKRFPLFFLRLRSGVFWNYMDENEQHFLVEEETSYPCAVIDPRKNNGYRMKILYYHKRISLEAFHALSDGTGALEFIKSIVYYYLRFKGADFDSEGKIMLVEDGVGYEELEDSFKSNYKKVKVASKQRFGMNRDSYRIKGNLFKRRGTNVTTGVVDAEALVAIARERGATVTSFVSALLMQAIYEARLRGSGNKKPVVLTVPVSLRQKFASRTMRNFFAIVNLSYRPGDIASFWEMTAELTRQLKEKTQKENLQQIIAQNSSFERNAARFAPLLLKRPAIIFGFTFFAEVKKTMTFSNMGNIRIPEGMKPHIHLFEVNLYPTEKSLINCSACSVNGRMTIAFPRATVEDDVICCFFKLLREGTGLEVETYSNNWGMEDEREY